MGQRVECEVEDCDVAHPESGRMVPGVIVTCMECDHSEECMGQSGRSVRRALAQMSENCPEGLDAYYVPDEERPD